MDGEKEADRAPWEPKPKSGPNHQESKSVGKPPKPAPDPGVPKEAKLEPAKTGEMSI